jgi:hypothetical protein
VKAKVEAVLNGVGSRPYTGLVRSIVFPNFGDVPLPKVKLVLQQAQVPLGDFATAFANLKNADAIVIVDDDANFVRERLGMAPLDAQQIAKAKAEKEARAALVAKATQGRPGDEDEEDAELEEDAPPAKFSAPPPPRAWTPRRVLRVEEKHLAFAEMARFLDGARDEFETEGKELLEKALRRALPAIREAMKDGDPSELAELELNLDDLSDYVEAFLEQARAEGYRHARSEYRKQPEDLVAQRQEGAAEPVKFAAEDEMSEEERDSDVPEGDVPLEPRTTSIAEAEAKARTLVRTQRDRLLQRMRARTIDDLTNEAIEEIRTKGLGAIDAGTVVERVTARMLESHALRQDAGLVLAKSFSMGREQFAQERGSEVAEVRLSAILDSGTCVPCNELDGRTFAFNSAEHQRYTPPLRDCEGQGNCRCLAVYVFKRSGFQRVRSAP